MTTNHPTPGEQQLAMCTSHKEPMELREVLPDGREITIALPSVHGSETSAIRRTRSKYRDLMVLPLKDEVEFAAKVYKFLDDRDSKKRTKNFYGCRSYANFLRHTSTGEIRVTSTRCNLRWCPLCIRTKRMILQDHVGTWIKTRTEPKFLTLTLKHSDAPLAHQIRSLYDYFRKLRSRAFWRKHARGGIWFFQIKWAETSQQWHPHLHVILDSGFMLHAELKRLWMEITNGSEIVDIRAVRDPQKIADYVARYASVPCSLNDLTFTQAVEVVDAMHGTRVCGSFGTAKVVALKPMPPEDAHAWEFMASWWIVTTCRHWDEYCYEIWQAYVETRMCMVASAGLEVSCVREEPPDLSYLETRKDFCTQLQFDFMKASDWFRFWENEHMAL